MKLRTLLLASYHFPPSAASGSFRLLGFARHLLINGWRTVVVAPPHMPYEPTDEKLARRVPPETAVHWVPYPRDNRMVRRLAPYAVWVPAAYRACVRVIAQERPHALLTSGPPHTIHLLGRLLKSRYRLPWIVDCRDPWVHGLGQSLPATCQTRWEALKERLVLKAADGIVVNTPLARAALEKDVPAFADKMTVITNGFDPENFIGNAAAAAPAGEFSILHTGELYAGRDPRPLFDALVGLHLAPGLKPLRLCFLGNSSDPNRDWPGEAQRRGLENVVRFAGQVPYSQALSRMQGADLLLLLDNPGRRVGIPAKLYEYFGARRPILALTEPHGDTAWALRRSGVQHRIVAPTDSDQLRQALTELVQESSSLRSTDAQPIPEEFTRAYLAARLAHLLDRITARRHTAVAR
jgi:glycosyltransferase involved in cell wall biosynthesis